jgi:hypothetical protein
MRIRSMVFGAVAVAVLASLPVRAEEAPAMPAPAPELKQLAFFDGDWKCTGKADASPFGPEHATQATVQVHDNLGGFWHAGRYEEKKTAVNPQPMSFDFVWGYDPAAKAWTLDGFDALGNRSQEKSSGWQNGMLVYEGTSSGPGAPTSAVRDTFTKKSGSVLEHFSEMQVEGKWVRLDLETCTRK